MAQGTCEVVPVDGRWRETRAPAAVHGTLDGVDRRRSATDTVTCFNCGVDLDLETATIWLRSTHAEVRCHVCATTVAVRRGDAFRGAKHNNVPWVFSAYTGIRDEDEDADPRATRGLFRR